MELERSVVEILKKLALHWTIKIEFAHSETVNMGIPIFRMKIKRLNIEVEDTFEKAVRELKELVDIECAVE